MERESDRYFVKDEHTLSAATRKEKKENNIYLIKLLVKLCDDLGEPKLAAPYMQQVLSEKLLHTTCPQDKELALKIKKLVFALDHPEKRDVFMRSGFVRAFYELRLGASVEGRRWTDYKPTGEALKEGSKGAIIAALHFYREDPSVPIGLDFSKAFDAFITKNGDKYSWKTLDPREKLPLVDAFRRFTGILQGSNGFKCRYVLD